MVLTKNRKDLIKTWINNTPDTTKPTGNQEKTLISWVGKNYERLNHTLIANTQTKIL